MEITTRYVLSHFLKLFREQMDRNRNDEMDTFFEEFFLKEELIAIVESIYPKGELKGIPIWDFKKYELLEMIGDHRFILDHYLNRWEQERKWKGSITQKGVWDTLERLGQQTHYLWGKPIASWDGYDRSNYASMLWKCGKVTTVYGVYDAEVEEQDAHLADRQPKRFFPSRNMAELALDEIARSQALDKDSLKVIALQQAL